MKRSAVAVAMASGLLLGALPAGLAPLVGVTPAAAADEVPVDPALETGTQGGGTVRVNVVTQTRSDVATAAAAGETEVAYERLPMVTLTVDQAGLTTLRSNPDVVSVTEDVPVAPMLDESTVRIGADKAFAAGATGAGTAVAVIDTGVAKNHPFLGGRVTAEACFSVNDESYGATSLCPNGEASQEGTGSADADTGSCAELGAACSHGTHVAGIAAGDGTGLSGAPKRGVAPGANIVAMQVFSRFDSDDYCGAGNSPCVLSFTSSQIKALEKVYALKQSGMDIIAANMSLGAGRWTTACDTDPRKSVIDSLYSVGVATVVAAGNNGYGDAVNAPGCVPSAVTVGATTDDDQVASFSNRGPLLDLMAPGTSVVSSVPGGGYAAKNGTSMAAPHVAGSLALLRQKYPAESIANLVAKLGTTGTPITYTGAVTPRIDVGKAVVGTVAPEPAPAARPRPSQVFDDTDRPIPDAGALEAPLTVTGVPGNAPKALRVELEGYHDWRGDLKIDLVAPDGRLYRLKSTSATETGGALGGFTVDASASPASGTWKLQVTDASAGGKGTLYGWSLNFPTPFAMTGNLSVPDGGSVTSDLTVDGIGGKAPAALQVAVDVTHEWRGDVRIELLSPDGRTYPLRSTSTAATENGGVLRETYRVDASASPADGKWTLKVSDPYTGSVGTLNAWSMTFPAYEVQTPHSVPDPGTIAVPVTVTGIAGNAPKNLQVYLHATHTWRGDLDVHLVAPDGKVYLVKESVEDEGNGVIQQVYTVDASASPASGVWKLRVEDISAGSSGTLDHWTLKF
ncbi:MULTISPECIES: proprotein convertase P-domain-containing protein [Streptomyces]|uniref:proprotein convertase P-domain-containing protein n=1 Tax=Streptomyces TaxID=1883 RepID=UPI000B0DEE08|nr:MULTISPECIES: proprotein convertase P-domain-containing protein [Streptomyces]